MAAPSALPQTMRATVIKAYLPHDTPLTKEFLEIQQAPLPSISKNQVLVKVKAASINPVDYKILQGYFSAAKSVPAFPGLDFAGVVVKTDSNVTKFKIGDRVYGYAHFKTMGSFGEYTAIEQQYMAHMPANATFAQAASLPVAAQSSYQALFDHGKLQKGQKVLILGGSGGTGIMGLQLAKWAQASEIVATCSARNAEFVMNNGATRTIDYTAKKWWEELKGQNFDLIYDTVGGYESWQHAPEVLKTAGHFVTIAGDAQAPVTLGRLIGAGASVVNRKFWSLFGDPSYDFFRCDCNTACLTALAKIFEQGQLKAVIEKEFPFDEVIAMYQHSMGGRTKGKLVLIVDPQDEAAANKNDDEKKAN